MFVFSYFYNKTNVPLACCNNTVASSVYKNLYSFNSFAGILIYVMIVNAQIKLDAYLISILII